MHIGEKIRKKRGAKKAQSDLNLNSKAQMPKLFRLQTSRSAPRDSVELSGF